MGACGLYVCVYIRTCLHVHVRVCMCIIIVCNKYFSNIIIYIAGLQILLVGEEEVEQMNPSLQNKWSLLVELSVIRDLGMQAPPTRKGFLMSTTQN